MNYSKLRPTSKAEWAELCAKHDVMPELGFEMTRYGKESLVRSACATWLCRVRPRTRHGADTHGADRHGADRVR